MVGWSNLSLLCDITITMILIAYNIFWNRWTKLLNIRSERVMSYWVKYDALILTYWRFLCQIDKPYGIWYVTNQINGQKKIYKCIYKDVQRFIGNCFKKKNISIIMSLLCDSNLTSLCPVSLESYAIAN